MVPNVGYATASRPFYATIWFGLFATVVVTGVIFLAATSMPSLEGRPTRGFGQVGVMLVAAYWVLLFPRLRKVRRGAGKSGPDSNPPADR
jgi:hypothetical protein